jgi:hypothetical protein
MCWHNRSYQDLFGGANLVYKERNEAELSFTREACFGTVLIETQHGFTLDDNEPITIRIHPLI